MLSWVKNLLGKTPESAAAEKLYQNIVSQARLVDFYRNYGVADDVDGRFDMIAVHLFLVLDRLKEEPSIRPVTQALVNLVVADMDSSLREMGASDMSVGKKVQKMARALYGRIEAYQAAMDDGEEERLADAVLRNVYRREEGERAGARAVARYMNTQKVALAACPLEKFGAGQIGFLKEGAFQ